MREFVLNDTCFGGALSIGRAATITIDIERGIVALINEGHGVASMRLAASIGDVVISPGVTLADVLTHVLRSTTSGRLLTRMATKYPIEDDLNDGEFAALVEWAIPTYPGAMSLVLCARSGRIAVTISDDALWTVDPLQLNVETNPDNPGVTVQIAIDNVFSAASAAALSNRLTAAFVETAKPTDLWRNRARTFPNLDFSPRVEGDLTNLGPTQYESAVRRLVEINAATSGWAEGMPSPTYLSKITGETTATMNKYGYQRIFRSSNGSDEVFELHARLAGGFRLHLREITETRRVEVGYIGPHLSIASEN